MSKRSNLKKLHDEILNINSFKNIEHEEIATTAESTSRRDTSLHIPSQEEATIEKERNLYYSFLFNDNKHPITKGIKNKLIRYDAFGQKITKDKKKQRVSFIDELNKYKPIAIITNIESYKKSYNKVRYGKSSHSRVNCNCCVVF